MQRFFVPSGVCSVERYTHFLSPHSSRSPKDSSAAHSSLQPLMQQHDTAAPRREQYRSGPWAQPHRVGPRNRWGSSKMSLEAHVIHFPPPQLVVMTMCFQAFLSTNQTTNRYRDTRSITYVRLLKYSSYQGTTAGQCNRSRLSIFWPASG